MGKAFDLVLAQVKNWPNCAMGKKKKSQLNIFESKSVIGGSYFQEKEKKTSLICSIVLRGSYGLKERDGICLDRPLFEKCFSVVVWLPW